MKTCINGKLFKKFFLAGILIFSIISTATGQLTIERVRNAVRESVGTSKSQQALNSLEAHRNRRCSSGTVYVAKVYINGRYDSAAYYCENERSELNDVCNALAGNRIFVLKTEVIDNSSNQPSEADIEAERQRQAEIERQKEAERLEKQRQFDESKQGLLSNLKGMSQEVTKPLEIIGSEKNDTNSMKLIGMKQTPVKSLELIGANPTSDKTTITVSPGQWTMTPDQLERELKMSRTAYELAMQQINNYEKNKSSLQQEIAQLTIKNNDEVQQVYDYEKNIAILEYKRTLVALYGLDNIRYANDIIKEQEGILQQKYAVPTSDIESFKSEVNTICSKIDYKMDADPDAEVKVLKGAVAIAKGTIELSYSNPKNKLIENLSKLKEEMNSNNSLIESKKKQSEGLTVEYERLQKVFQKYGKDILESHDDAKIIQFGNECRNALNIKIEEQY